MNLRSTLTNLDADKLQKLLHLGIEADPDEGEFDKEDDLRRETLRTILSEPSPVASPHAPNQTTLDCLMDENQPIATFQLLKDYFKSAAVAWQPESSADAARVLYYAVVAAALTYHGRVLTRLDSQERNNALAYLADAAWTPPPLASLFRRAKDASPEAEPVERRQSTRGVSE